MQHGAGALKAGLQHIGRRLQAGEDGSQHFHQAVDITGGQCRHRHVDLQTRVKDIADLITAAAIHQVPRLRNDKILAAAILAAQDIGDLQSTSAVAGIQHDDLPILQIGLAGIGDASMGIRSRDDHDHVHVIHDFIDPVRNNRRCGLAGNDAGDLDCFEFLQTMDFFLVDVIQLGDIALAGENGGHALSACARSDNRKFQHLDSLHISFSYGI